MTLSQWFSTLCIRITWGPLKNANNWTFSQGDSNMQPKLGTIALQFSYIYLGTRYCGIGERGLILELISPSFSSWVISDRCCILGSHFFKYKVEVKCLPCLVIWSKKEKHLGLPGTSQILVLLVLFGIILIFLFSNSVLCPANMQ